MCLSTITHRFDPPDPNEVTAWKVFNTLNNSKHFPYCVLHWLTIVETNRWLSAVRHLVMADYYKDDVERVEYFTGFHAFSSKEQAEKYAAFLKSHGHAKPSVYKVKLRGVRTTGTQLIDNKKTLLDVLVADEMFVPEQEHLDLTEPLLT